MLGKAAGGGGTRTEGGCSRLPRRTWAEAPALPDDEACARLEGRQHAHRQVGAQHGHTIPRGARARPRRRRESQHDAREASVAVAVAAAVAVAEPDRRVGDGNLHLVGGARELLFLPGGSGHGGREGRRRREGR